MTTKKKNSRSDRENKPNLDEKTELRAERIAELSSSVSFTESYNAIHRFRDSLDDALVAIDNFASGARRVSHELRQEGFDVEADFLSTWANMKTPLTTNAFRKAAQMVVDVVFIALVTGSRKNLLDLERILSDRGPGRTEWVRLCSTYRELLRDEPLPFSFWAPPSQNYDPWLSDILGDNRLFLAQRLIGLLTRIDGCAEALTPKQVVELAENSRTDAGFAATLALMCKGFGYDWEAELEKQPEEDKNPKKAQEIVQDRAPGTPVTRTASSG